MRILSITAGAAGMYCGSCTRDNALARELLARGHDVTLVPVYTPTRPDEPNLGPVPTTQLNWLQPHEGNIVDFLFRARAFQTAPLKHGPQSHRDTEVTSR